MKRVWHRFIGSRIGRYLIGFAALILLVSFLFLTPWGNRLLSPAVESLLETAFSTDIDVESFTLGQNRFELAFHDSYGNHGSLIGGHSLLTLRLYAHYRLDAPVTGGINPLPTPLKADGALSGGYTRFRILGNAHLYDGNAVYEVNLFRFHLSRLKLELTDIDYEELLRSFDYPSDTDTRLSGSILLSGFDRRDVSGTVDLSTQTARFDPTPIKQDDNETFDLRTLLSDEYGRIKPFELNVTATAQVDHAGVLEQFTTIPLCGKAQASATLTGNKQRLDFHARSSIAGSNTTLDIAIPDLDPSMIRARIAHADIPGLFGLFCLPSPITGKGDFASEINAKKMTLDAKIRDARTLPAVFKQEYHLTQPPIRFSADIHADAAREGGVRYRAAFESDLQRLEFDANTTHTQMLRDLLNAIP